MSFSLRMRVHPSGMATFLSAGKPIRMDCHEPPEPGRHPAILLLHGSGGNVRFWADRIAPHLTSLRIGLYAVHYFDRTATVRADAATILDGVHYPLWLETISDAIAYLRSRPAVDPNRLVLLGVSLGAFLALSTAVLRTGEIRAVMEISGGLPEPYVSRAASAFPPTLIVHGAADTVVPVAQAETLDALLTRLGVPHTTEILPGQGHWFDPSAQLRILLSMAGFLRRHM